MRSNTFQIRCGVIVALLVAGALCGRPADACDQNADGDAADASHLRSAVEALGSRDYRARLDATTRLETAAAAGVDAISSHANWRDPEVVCRAIRILEKIGACRKNSAAMRAIAVLDALSESEDSLVARRAARAVAAIEIGLEEMIATVGGKVSRQQSASGETSTRVTFYNSKGSRAYEQLRCVPRLSLVLSGNSIDDDDCRSLGALDNLRVLDLRYTRVGDAGLKSLPANIETLYLSNTRVTDAGLEHLSKLRLLQTLYLSGTEVTDACLPRLAACQSLKHVSLRKTAVTSDGVQLLTARKSGIEVSGP